MKKRILVLDDNQDILDIVCEALSYEEYEVSCADNCRLFFEQLAVWKPDLVLVDYKLADGDGCAICKALKNDPETQHLGAIIFSAYSAPAFDFASCGCDAIIKKPFDLSELVEKVQEVLSATKV